MGLSVYCEAHGRSHLEVLCRETGTVEGLGSAAETEKVSCSLGLSGVSDLHLMLAPLLKASPVYRQVQLGLQAIRAQRGPVSAKG